jgi:hypothetical protein
MAKHEELSDDLKRQFKQIVDHFDNEDRAVRDRQIKTWRQLKLMWENVHHAYYSEVAHDWRVPDLQSTDESDQGSYDKPINIYRAYLESIIAALSVTVPPVVCYPDDADNTLDCTTAKAGNKIAELVFKHNDMPLLWLHALFIHMTEGMTAMYTYPKESEEYGTYEEKEYEEDTEEHEISTCPMCNAEMGDKTLTPDEMMQQAIAPDDTQVEMPEIPSDAFMPEDPEEMEECQSCGNMVTPQKEQSTLTVTRLVGVTKKAKSRICMEVYGGLFVKVPIYARNQSECPYLIYSYETHYATILEQYPELRDKIVRESMSSYDQYEQWGRISPQYRGEWPIHNVTIRNCWFRTSAFNVLPEDECDELKKKYPHGVKVVVVNDQVADACTEALDDCWTLTHNPLSDYLHFDPVGLLLTSVQDITNDLISLVVQTVEHGIPQTFADPKVLNFNSYRNSEVIPGGIYPATPKSGKSLSDGFYEVRTATLSQEVLPFATKIQELGQVVSGALPSLFGGQMTGSRTASEYSMSRAQALQRLQSTWKMLLYWWKNVHGKVIPMFIKEMKDDEKQVKKDEFGNFINVFIRRAELEGKIGSIEIEANENLPITWNQQKDAIMELLQINNEGINKSLMSPENMPYLQRAIGLNDYIIPGEDDRQKQYEEILQLTNSEPIEIPPDPMMMQQAMMMGQPPPPPQRLPSVQAEFEIDDHPLEADICRRWLVSDAGRMCKLENPPGYENVLLHMKMHKDMFVQMTQPQGPPMGPPPGPGGPPPNAPKPPQPNAGVQMNEGQNAPTIQ